MIPLRTRIFLFSRSVWHAILGILAEFLLVAALILTGFIVCIFWWGIFR